LSCNHFGQELVDDVAKSYRPKLLRMVHSLFLGDESKESGIKGWEDLPGDSRVLNDVPNFLSEHGPTMMKEIRSEAIGSWGFSFRGVLKSLVHFLKRDWSK